MNSHDAGPAWKAGEAGNRRGIRASVFRAWRMNLSGDGHPFEAGWARKRWESCSPSSAVWCLWKMKLSGCSHRLEPGRARKRWESCSPSSAGL
jgi:hypothetical protein